MMNKKKESPFFVGYLDMPKALERFYWPLSLLLFVLCLLAGYGLASTQKSTPPASWQTSQTETIRGLLQVDPYPVLHRTDPDNPDQIQSILLVKQGKFSADTAAAPFHNQIVTVSGFPIHHGGWDMLEITADSDIQVDNAASDGIFDELMQKTAPITMGTVDLSGEVMDSKCYLGVMKPGEGPVHKACAEVCLLGGMPTMLVVRGDDNYRYGYVLVNHDESSVSPQYAPLAGENHQISGEMIRKGDLLYIKMSPVVSTASL